MLANNRLKQAAIARMKQRPQDQPNNTNPDGTYSGPNAGGGIPFATGPQQIWRTIGGGSNAPYMQGNQNEDPSGYTTDPGPARRGPGNRNGAIQRRLTRRV